MTRASILRASILLLAACAILLDTRPVVTGPDLDVYLDASMTVTEINPDAVSGGGNLSAGGRIQHVAVNGNGSAYYAASELGGLYKSVDAGVTWTRLDGYTPQAAWDVAVDPANPQKVYATSRYDGRVTSRAGISVSEDGGGTWTNPATATPPEGFCEPARREQPSAFGIDIDPADSNHVWIGTNCGVARSVDGGATWTFHDPTPKDPPDEVFDVAVHNGIVDIVGLDGHARSIDSGVIWTLPDGFPVPTGSASIAVSPDEDYVLYVTAGTYFYESLDGGANWSGALDVPGKKQGRRLFVRLNKRAGSTYDFWTGDVDLSRTTCTTPPAPAPGGSSRCDYNAWMSGLQAGAHGDVADVVFDPTVAVDACPKLYANDGGVHRNTSTTSPACHTPTWVNPDKAPHALFLWSLAIGPATPDLDAMLMIGSQDNGGFRTFEPGAAAPQWLKGSGGGDTFDIVANTQRVIVTTCCLKIFAGSPTMTSMTEIKTYPPGTAFGFVYGDIVAEYEPNRYVMVTGDGAFVTPDIEADPVVWTELGGASFPGRPTIRVSQSAGPHFFVQTGIGANYTFTSDSVWRYDGAGPAGTWQQIPPPGGSGGFSVFDVNPFDPNMIVASHLPASGDPQMVRTIDGGTNWTPLPELDALMTANGQFRYRNQFGPTRGALNEGYPQPTLVAFDRVDPNIVVSGASDAGLFFSRDGGVQWTRVKNPFWAIDGTPHISRPKAAGFVHTDISMMADRLDMYVGTRGRGVFRVRTRVTGLNLRNLCDVFPRLCNPIPIPNPLEFLLWPIGEDAVYVDALANHGGCSRECPPFFNLFLDGFDAASWDVSVFDARGAAVPHGFYRTERGVVIGLQTVDGMFSGYRLAFAQRAGTRPLESRFTSRLEGSDRAYVPRSIADIIY
jgi:hypothetical protein